MQIHYAQWGRDMSWMLTSGALETSALAAYDSVVAACGQCQHACRMRVSGYSLSSMFIPSSDMVDCVGYAMNAERAQAVEA